LDELSDCFITLMNVAIWSGFGSLDLENAIEKKIAINNQRLEKRYSKGETR
jgi:NTP pyrophosphatase (non-canonical NTP hydrolase)